MFGPGIGHVKAVITSCEFRFIAFSIQKKIVLIMTFRIEDYLEENNITCDSFIGEVDR